ncbi:1-phosphatidylinositol 4,5-bisphosphate phosphodiesterase eta-2 [Holothuria leucospilota]|uniref:Phosphoinositide phospholipase C n=1 Tax=Holothuria leucospilota TaxID=206669 RepID=A0A9Q0YK38_HOLLE|nr:1-phosphatidylinositol 4,5-bisphosphate phosphodiesterase eta-2 [Holothuria leucospilota]
MDEVQRLLHKMNVNLSKRKVKQLFKEADTNTTDDNEGLLNFDEFVCFYKRLSTRPELLSLLQEYAGGKDFLTRQDFELFLRLEQGEKQINGDIVKDLMERFEPVPENLKEGRLGIDGFTRYLMSEEGDLFNVQHRGVNQDMTQPLCHYYIASSHNTYLLGDQVMSHSSVDVYGAVLQSGCRCVEMDCWDGKDGEPVVYHGYTLTTKIKCRDVITVINKYAFVSSPYPVILSIENHCNLQQQKKLANYLIDILGDKLIIQDWDLKRLPSPEALKGKILIKTQKLPLDHDEELEAGEVSEEDSADELDEDFKLEKSGSSKFENLVVAQWALKKKSPIKPTHAAWQRIAVKARESSKRHRRSSSGLSGTLRKLKASRKKSRSESSESEGGEEGDLSVSKRNSLRRNSSAPPQQTWKKKSIILSKQLSDLVKYTRSVAFSGFPADMPCWELPSLGEMRASNLVATRSMEFVNFTSRNLCRVYPSAYRIDSSNYNPQPMWNCGCQLVALNYQTEGRVMQIARAKFNSNGNCGYVLKPQVMREETCSFEPNLCDPVTNQKKLLTIRIISGQQLPKPPQSLLGERGEIIDPYVEVEVIGLPVDCFKAVTKTVQDNGFNPNWNQTVFFTVHMPDIALLRFVVWDEDPIGRDYIGQATFAVRSLSPGYRHLHLESLDHATLFVHIMIEDFDEKALHRLSRARSNNKSDYARTKSVDLDIPVVGYSSKLSPRRGSKIPLTQRFNIMRRHTAASIFMVGDPQTSPVISQAKRQSTSVVDNMREEEHKDGEGPKCL